MKWPEGSPVGEVTRLAQSPPRPALRLLSDSLPPSLVKGLRSGRDLARARREGDGAPPLVTTVAALDHLLQGGIPRGRLVEVFGRRSSGRFSTVLGTLAAATGIGEAAALVDLGDGLDPVSARRAGIALERLLWLRPLHLKQALHGAEMLLSAGFPLVVVDLGNPPLKGSARMATAWLRLARAAQKRQAALLLASPYRISGAAASVVIQARRGRPRWSRAGNMPPLLQGLEGQWTLEKSRGRRPGEQRALQLRIEPLPLSETTRPGDTGSARRHQTGGSPGIADGPGARRKVSEVPRKPSFKKIRAAG